MSKFYGKIKQGLMLITAGSLAATLYISPARADSTDEPYLRNIQDYTNSILSAVNNIPAYLAQITQMAASFMASDNSGDPIDWSSNWTNQQNLLVTLNSNAVSSEANQYTLQQTLLTNFFGSNHVTASPPVPYNLNDISYTTLLGQPLASSDPRSEDFAMNYLVNASGLGIPLEVPDDSWSGEKDYKLNYKKFYNATTSVQTYNAFVLSRLYQESKTTNQNATRMQLIAQSGNSDWFSAIISNDLGWVLRQILLYNSQMFLLLDQLVQSQRQMAASLAMTNTLLIISNQFQGKFLLDKAKGS
jgi:hypothetical protein